MWVAGRVVDDSDYQTPVAGALVKLSGGLSQGTFYDPRLGVSATTDDTGSFAFRAAVPEDWREVRLDVAAAGHESTSIHLPRWSIGSVVLRLYRNLTIRVGESINTHITLDSYTCGDESALCRRVVLESPPGEVIELEVTAWDGQRGVGVTANKDLTGPSHRIATTAGDVWILAFGSGRVTLAARPWAGS